VSDVFCLIHDNEAELIVKGSPILCAAVNKAMREAWGPDMPLREKARAIRCAAYLFSSGWLDKAQSGLCGTTIKSLRKEAVRELKKVGILPGGIVWFLIRWFVIPFLSELLREWIFGEGE